MKFPLLILFLFFVALVSTRESVSDELEEALLNRFENYENMVNENYKLKKMSHHPRNLAKNHRYKTYNFRKLPSSLNQWEKPKRARKNLAFRPTEK